MQSATVSISSANGVHVIKPSGRATFECVAPLRDFSKIIENAEFSEIDVDLSECTGMDSTFMGILAMIGLRAKKIGANMSICNANDLNKSLLFGLGLKKLFHYPEGKIELMQTFTGSSVSGGQSAMDSAKTVLDAHKTLMDVDEENKKKFEKVVDLVQQDIDRMNNAGKNN